MIVVCLPSGLRALENDLLEVRGVSVLFLLSLLKGVLGSATLPRWLERLRIFDNDLALRGEWNSSVRLLFCLGGLVSGRKYALCRSCIFLEIN